MTPEVRRSQQSEKDRCRLFKHQPAYHKKTKTSLVVNRKLKVSFLDRTLVSSASGSTLTSDPSDPGFGENYSDAALERLLRETRYVCVTRGRADGFCCRGSEHQTLMQRRRAKRAPVPQPGNRSSLCWADVGARSASLAARQPWNVSEPRLLAPFFCSLTPCVYPPRQQGATTGCSVQRSYTLPGF